jgi:isoquinoline 1-oxidoreductase beta subunit
VRFGNQDTDGSRSMRHWYEPMRRCGAAARTMLEQAAAAQWQVPSAMRSCTKLHTPSGRELGYGELAAAASALAVPAVTAAPQAAVGVPLHRQGRHQAIDGADIVNGRAVYGADVHFDGMLYATIARPAVYGGKVKSLDDSAALKVRVC